jgi:hypothetical protein
LVVKLDEISRAYSRHVGEELRCRILIRKSDGKTEDGLCGLVIRFPGYRLRGPGSIPEATRFSEKYWVWNGLH